jgi:hypothetical protein
VLVAWSAAGGAVPSDVQITSIRSACEAAGRELDELDVLHHVSFGRLSDALADAKRDGVTFDALHILCHGGADGDSGYGLLFDNEFDGAGAVLVGADRLQQLLAPYAGMIRVVFLAACNSGDATNADNRLGSVAQMLHRVGFAAVVASRYPLSEAAANRATEAFYRQFLASGTALDESFICARKAVARDPTSFEWASLQLYARATDVRVTPPPGLQDSAQGPSLEQRSRALTRGRLVALALFGLVALTVTVTLVIVGQEDGLVTGGEASTTAATDDEASATTSGATAVTTSGVSSTHGTSTGPKSESPEEEVIDTACPEELVKYFKEVIGHHLSFAGDSREPRFLLSIDVHDLNHVVLSSCRSCDTRHRDLARERLGDAEPREIERLLPKSGPPCFVEFGW